MFSPKSQGKRLIDRINLSLYDPLCKRRLLCGLSTCASKKTMHKVRGRQLWCCRERKKLILVQRPRKQQPIKSDEVSLSLSPRQLAHQITRKTKHKRGACIGCERIRQDTRAHIKKRPSSMEPSWKRGCGGIRYVYRPDRKRDPYPLVCSARRIQGPNRAVELDPNEHCTALQMAYQSSAVQQRGDP